MKHLTLNPDPWNAWIYDPKHPDYHSKHAEYLRVARARAINNAPAWMLRVATQRQSLPFFVTRRLSLRSQPIDLPDWHAGTAVASV